MNFIPENIFIDLFELYHNSIGFKNLVRDMKGWGRSLGPHSDLNDRV